MKLLAIHLSKASSAEANVLGNLLANAVPELEVTLLANRLQRGEPGSYFDQLDGRPRYRRLLEPVGLALGPQDPAPLFARVARRVEHVLRAPGLVRLSRRLAPDVVYSSQQRFDCALASRVALELGVPQAIHLHYTPGPWLGAHVLERLHTCDKVIAVSAFIAREAEAHGVPRERIAIVPNSIPPRVQAPRPEEREGGPIVLGQIARMVQPKGFEDTVRAFALLREKLPAAKLVLVGDGSGRAAVEALVRELGLAEHVELAGEQRDIWPWLARFDVFVHPSRREPFGIALLEAMEAGLPVVAYADGAAAEVVEDGRTGLLARTGDIADLADKLARLCQDAAARKAMGAAGRVRARTHFSPTDAGAAFSRALLGLARR